MDPMATFTVILLVLVGVAIVLAVWIVGIFNKLVMLRNRFKNGFAQIEVQLKRRYDLIPNMIEVAKGYMKHERDTLEAVIQARNMAAGGLQKAAQNPGDAAAMQGLASAEGALTGTLGRLFALAESYPDLKAVAGGAGVAYWGLCQPTGRSSGLSSFANPHGTS
jgi:LemA protein